MCHAIIVRTPTCRASENNSHKIGVGQIYYNKMLFLKNKFFNVQNVVFTYCGVGNAKTKSTINLIKFKTFNS